MIKGILMIATAWIVLCCNATYKTAKEETTEEIGITLYHNININGRILEN